MDYDALSADEVEAQFNPRVAIEGFEGYLEDFAERSRAARARLNGRFDLRYGDAPLQTLDVFPARGEHPPLHVFIHGGYWRALDKSDHSFTAEPFVAAGATTVVLNYDLCPAVTLDTVVAEVRQGIAWIYRHAGALGGDPERLYLSGHSAGAHLAVMALAHDWQGSEGLPADLVKGVAAVSGVYELAPLLRVSVNDEIGLTREMALRNSPTRHPPGPVAPLLIAVGGDETAAWIRQSEDFHEACRTRGVDCALLRLEHRHHFSIAFAMAEPGNELFQAICRLMALA